MMVVAMNEAAFLASKDRIRERLNKFTRKAFQMLPEVENPEILDIGCGSGVPTMELSRMTGGHITAIDIDPEAIAALKAKVESAGLSGRVKAINRSMLNMDFPVESFDIIWAEGSIATMGFERGLRKWRRLLRQGGFMVVHDERGDLRRKLSQVAASGYELLRYFSLDEETWRKEYYIPVQRLIRETRMECADDPQTIAFLDEQQKEIDWFKNNPGQCSSVFFILRKI